MRSGVLAGVLLAAVMGAQASEPVAVTRATLDRYWELAPERMGAVMPPSARGIQAVLQRHGDVHFAFEVTIDAQGVPRDLVVRSITPAQVDPAPFVATQLFHRYRPAPTNPEARPVRLSANDRNWLPKQGAE